MSGTFVVKRAVDGRFLFNLKAGNGEIIFTSGIYGTRDAAFKGIAAVRANGSTDERYERKLATSSEPYFVLKSSNGEVLGRSETYSSSSAMEDGIKSVMRDAPDAVVKDLTVAAAEPAHS